MAVQVVDALEMIEVDESKHRRLPAVERVADRAKQLPPVGQAGCRVGAGIALGEALGLLCGIKRLLEIPLSSPAEEDDGDVEEEGDRQARAGQLVAAEGRSEDLATEPDEHQDRRDGRGADDQLAAGDPPIATRHAARPHILALPRYVREVKISLPRHMNRRIPIDT